MRSPISRSSALVDLRYFLVLALRSFRRDRFLTISIMLTLGVGIAASMTVFSILHVLSGDPIPEKSARLFQPTISRDDLADNNRPHLYSLPDAQELIQQLLPPERGAPIRIAPAADELTGVAHALPAHALPDQLRPSAAVLWSGLHA